jgi:hypothetical protein
VEPLANVNREIAKAIEAKRKKKWAPNPWAVCTESTGDKTQGTPAIEGAILSAQHPRLYGAYTIRNLDERTMAMSRTADPTSDEIRQLATELNQKQFNDEDEALEYANKKMNGSGVEPIRVEGEWDRYYGDVIALYVNMGDTYDLTIVYDVFNGGYIATSWGDFLEKWEQDNRRGTNRKSAGSTKNAHENDEGKSTAKHRQNKPRKKAAAENASPHVVRSTGVDGRLPTAVSMTFAQWQAIGKIARWLPENIRQAQTQDFVQVGRDPFGRYDLVRRKMGGGECDWCGQKKKTIYQYGIWHDGGTLNWSKGKFCCKSCFRSYNS